MLRTLLNQNHAKFEALPTDGSISNTKLFTKAFAHGAIEGFVDGLVIVGAVTISLITVAAIAAAILPTEEETE